MDRQWVHAYVDDVCDWCGANYADTDDDHMCRQCFAQALQDDWEYEREQESRRLAEDIAQREEDEALAAVRRSMDALREP